MRILLIGNSSSIHMVRWANSLSEIGHEVHLCYIKNHKPGIHKINNSIILHPLFFGKLKGYFLNFLQLKITTKKIMPDIINVHYASGYGTLVRYSNIKPVLLSVWGQDVYDFPYKNRFFKKILIRNINYANHIASTSLIMANQVRNIMKNQNLDISITPFGVKVDSFKIPPKYMNKIVIGNIKALSPKYGIELMIRSISELINNLSDENRTDIIERLKVEIYGSGEQKNELMKLVEHLKLTNIVFFMGYIPNNEVPLALHKMTIFCVTSPHESFGVSVVEAMAAGLPVVATNVDGFKEVMENGQTGIIVENNNTTGIASALKLLILNPTISKQFGVNGRNRVKKLYNWDKNVENMLDVYEKTIRKIQ